ncbi:AAA family ATPase [Clostridium sp. NSJ-6]|uniref:AAA family ATPase n=1 Tax=Clostridium hominis TaxID=2763036 RepID=A0ABR7DDJ0_9CLOT|nr:UvrD-helicase domain-containing protein [Clostridium hominis]MBC5629460.1 AAA family ATPase [Clostridium hominis]MDU2670525.1 AAA family ATPase [Clostridium sp.]
MLIGKDIKDEEKYLSNTIDTINSLLNNYGVSSSKQDKSIIEHRKFLWDNRSELDEIEINENCGQVALEEKLYASKLSRIKTLERQLKSPYFARLDFKEDGEEVESFYIGLSTVENEEDFEFIVFDWRSPVSNMFYDFEVGPAYYKAPNRTINGQIEFSRQFNIKNGKIVFMHNSNESLCDENLSTMLSRNATEKMKNIVATIQKEQNDIIRNDDSKILFIQGAAGSGKTSIALHRAAYLLYKNRKNLTADNILIFSPNEVFAEYISDVLPDLGESNILQTTFELYSKRFLPTNYIFESKNDHLDYIYSVDRNSDSFKIRANSMEYKNTTEFMHILDKYTNDLPNHLIEIRPIIIDNNEVISKSSVKKTFLNRFKDIPLLNRIDVVKQSLFSQLETKYLASDNNIELDYIEDKEEFYSYCKEEVSNQVDKMIKTLDNVAIYKLLWENIEKYTKDDLKEIKDYTIEYISDKEVKFEDLTPIIYIRAAMEGFRNYSNMKHILIDEAQDYSPLFYQLIRKSFNNAKITIMGDLNQRIDKYSNVKDKDSILEVFDDVKVAILSKSYRSTSNITMFAKEILDTYEPIEAVERSGENPNIIIEKDNLAKSIKNEIESMKSKGHISIAVICKNREKTKNIFDSLKELDLKININLIDNENSELKNDVNVISSYLAKGLEFDGVIIADGENYLNSEDSNLFYTVCTRALHKLVIFSSTSLDNILPNNTMLYDCV